MQNTGSRHLPGAVVLIAVGLCGTAGAGGRLRNVKGNTALDTVWPASQSLRPGLLKQYFGVEEKWPIELRVLRVICINWMHTSVCPPVHLSLRMFQLENHWT